MKTLPYFIVVLALSGLTEAMGQWNTSGNNIYNTNTGNVGIGNTVPTTLLHVAKTMTEPSITVQNLGGTGGATYNMIDNVSGAYWKFKATNTGGFKIRDHANLMDVFVIEPNSAANAVYISTAGSIGLGTAAPAASAALDVSSTDKGVLFPRMTNSQRTGIISPAAGLLVYQTDAPEGFYYFDGSAWIAISISNMAPTNSIGDFAHGGIVFWVDDTGQHGLVCAKQDQSSAIRWYAGGYCNTRVYGDGPFAGEMNTSNIIMAHMMLSDDGGNFAARLCSELEITEGGKSYGDWYLPSSEELAYMWLNKAVIDATAIANSGTAFISEHYWSSTEYAYYEAWTRHFGGGSLEYNTKNHNYPVRAVRAF